ncbi:MAG: serine protease [Vicinamibacterales bacterium]
MKKEGDYIAHGAGGADRGDGRTGGRMSAQEWTVEELVAELRRRQRRASSGVSARSAAATSRAGELDAVSTAELARMAQDRQRVVYGVDDRKDIFQVPSPKIRKASEAVVALVKAADLKADGQGGWTLTTTSYKEEYQLCSSEAFASQPLGCFCSGFLVRPDVIVTAGHCVKNAADLAKMRFVFGFQMINASTPGTSFGADDVYEGSALIGRKLTQDKTDWAVVRLTRAVVGRSPVSFRTAGKISAAQKLFVIGHPCGLPQKYAPGASVRDNTPAAFFVANLDTYGGNSGSPVFNATNQKVEGILVRGENDFVTNGSCYVSLVCPTTGCRGEDVTRSSEWAGKIPKNKARR